MLKKILITFIMVISIDVYAIEKMSAMILDEAIGPYDHHLYPMYNMFAYLKKIERDPTIYFPRDEYIVKNFELRNLSWIDKGRSSIKLTNLHTIRAAADLHLITFNERTGYYKFRLNINPVVLAFDDKNIVRAGKFEPMQSSLIFNEINKGEAIIEGKMSISKEGLRLVAIHTPNDAGFELTVMSNNEIFLKQTKNVPVTVTIVT